MTPRSRNSIYKVSIQGKVSILTQDAAEFYINNFLQLYWPKRVNVIFVTASKYCVSVSWMSIYGRVSRNLLSLLELKD